MRFDTGAFLKEREGGKPVVAVILFVIMVIEIIGFTLSSAFSLHPPGWPS